MTHILAFVAGASVFGAGILLGVSIVQGNTDRILKNGEE